MSDNPSKLPNRGRSAHKGNCGRVLILAGSRVFPGAAALALAGAARGGAGYVIGAVPRSISDKISIFLPSAIVAGQKETASGQFSFAGLHDILGLVHTCDALVLGPGWGKSEGLAALMGAVLKKVSVPVVLDADALNLLSDDLSPLANVPNLILTPHPGEAARLLQTTTSEIEKDRPSSLSRLIELQPSVFVLKGAGTLVGEKKQTFLNSTGNPAMAVAGMGDVLSGLIGALLAQGSDPYDAACQSVWAHGRAGDLAASEIGHRGVIPMDVVDRLPRALAELEE